MRAITVPSNCSTSTCEFNELRGNNSSPAPGDNALPSALADPIEAGQQECHPDDGGDKQPEARLADRRNAPHREPKGGHIGGAENQPGGKTHEKGF